MVEMGTGLYWVLLLEGEKNELLIHADQQPHRNAARPPLSQHAYRRPTVTTAHDQNDEHLLQRLSRATS
jgi:hypothetical protein